MWLDQHAINAGFGTQLTEVSKIKKITIDHAVVVVSAKGREKKRAKKGKKKGRKKASTVPPTTGRKPTHPVGELTRWKVAAELKIDHRTGLLVSRSESVEAGARMRWTTGLEKTASFTSKATVTCRDVTSDEAK